MPDGYNVREGGNDSGAKPVFKIEPGTGEILQEYPSITAAANDCKLDLSQLSKVCRKNSSPKSSGGFIWCFVSDYNKESLSQVKPHFLYQEIYQIKQGTNSVIKEWGGVAEAADGTGVLQSCISSCLSGKYKTAGGYSWCYKNKYSLFHPTTQFKQIVQMDKVTKSLISVFNNAVEASEFVFGDRKHVGGIRSSCNPACIQSSAYGYIWRYKDLYEKVGIYPKSGMDKTNRRKRQD